MKERMTERIFEFIKSIKGIGTKNWFVFIILIVLLTDIAILLDISFIRPVFGFLCFTIIPGLLILYALKLNKIGIVEKIVLSVGLSVSFLMFFGLLIDKLYFSLGYATPLSTISLVVSFSATIILFCVIGYKTNKEAFSFAMPDFNLNTAEKAFLIVPIFFPALSIFGMHVMNTTDNNIILMFLLFLIPIYVPFVCFFNQKFSNRLYPVAIFLISISLILLLPLKSNHLIGMDVHTEYYFFRTTLDNLHWSIIGHSTLDACLAISLLPTIYQSILNVNSEYLFKILYSLLYSVSPLVIYVISKKYVEESYAFLASCFFMFQSIFLATASCARSNLALLFFALAMMTLFNDKIDPLKKRMLFIVFMASCMVSHYSNTYIFFFVMVGTFIGIEALSKKYTFKKIISLTLVILFFAMIFFWYSQVTEAAFNAGVSFIEKTFKNLHEFFILESRGTGQALLGKDIMEKGIPHKIQFLFTWLTLIFIAIGVTTLIIRRKGMSFPELGFKKPDFLKNKFEVGYFVIALACAGLLVIVLAVPYIAAHYSLDRMYPLAITILSVFFVIGGIMLSKHFFFFKKRKTVLKEKPKGMFLVKFFTKPLQGLRGRGAEPHTGKKVVGKAFFSKERFEGKNALQNPLRKSVEGGKGLEVRAYLIILLVLIPYFFCVTGVMYNIFGVPRAVTLNSEGEAYDSMYVHDQECYGAKWLGKYMKQTNSRIYTDHYGGTRVVSQTKITSIIDYWSLVEHKKIYGYIYLRYYNVINEKLVGEPNVYNMTEYSDIFGEKDRIYDNGGSEIWR